MGFFQKFLNMSERACRFEFWTFVFMLCGFIILEIILWESSFVFEDIAFTMNHLFLIISSAGVFFALFRRWKDLNFSLTYVLENLFKINILLWTGAVIPSLTFLLFLGIDQYPIREKILIGIVYFFVIWAFAYFLKLFVPLLFFKGSKGKNDFGEEPTGKFEYKQPTKPKIGNFFNNNFFVRFFDYKSKTTQKEFLFWGILFVILEIINEVRFHLIYTLLNQLEHYLNYAMLAPSDCVVYSSEYDTIMWIGGIIFIGLLLIFSSLFIRRMRDLDLKPWHFIFFFVLPLNVVLLITLFFGKGKEN